MPGPTHLVGAVPQLHNANCSPDRFWYLTLDSAGKVEDARGSLGHATRRSAAPIRVATCRFTPTRPPAENTAEKQRVRQQMVLQ